MMGEDVRGDKGLLGPADAAKITEITPNVSEYRFFHLSDLLLHLVFYLVSKHSNEARKENRSGR